MQILRKTELEALEKARQLGAEGVLDALEEKKLVGRGGAAFPTAKKWRFAMEPEADTRYVICNADEGEPGTFKDKFILKYNPDTMIEGVLIAAETSGAAKAYIYLRGEYEHLRPWLEERIAAVTASADSQVDVEVVRGAGAYICGEETAIIQSIMGNRGHAMYKPPYPTVQGLWGKPTVTNNVETLTCVAQALIYDDWNPDLRLFSVSGNVTNPGVYELPLGVRMSSIVDIARPEKKLKAVSLGCFGGIMPIDESVRITNEFILKHNCHHGAYTLILIDEDTNVVDINLSIAKFYTYESCGKCTPCREGTVRLLRLLKQVRDGGASEEDLKTLEEFAHHVQETSLCGLGQTAGQHVITSLEHFRGDFEAYMKGGGT